MRSLAQLVIDNATVKFGVKSEDVELILYPDESGEDEPAGDDHRKTITIRQLRTIPSDDAACSNASSEWPGEVDRFLTVVEVLVVCRPPAALRDRDYYPNEARQLAEWVRAFFRGTGGTGLIIDRHAYDKLGAPIEGDGVMAWQGTDPQPQIPGDPSHALVLTYELNWWAPAPATS